MLDPLVLLALGGAGLLAGFVDAIAGGGGLIALPALLAAMPEIMDFPAGPQAGRYGGPVRCLRGERSDYVGPDGEAALRRLFPGTTIATVPGAGHWPHAEQPAAFLALLKEALAG